MFTAHCAATQANKMMTICIYRRKGSLFRSLRPGRVRMSGKSFSLLSTLRSSALPHSAFHVSFLLLPVQPTHRMSQQRLSGRARLERTGGGGRKCFISNFRPRQTAENAAREEGGVCGGLIAGEIPSSGCCRYRWSWPVPHLLLLAETEDSSL